MANLIVTFLNGEGKNHDWTYKDVDTTLSGPEIKEACELLTNLDIFEKDGVKLFDSVVTAKTVTTIETTIFDDEAEQPISKKPAIPKMAPFPHTEPVDNVEKSGEIYFYKATPVDKVGITPEPSSEPRISPYLLTKNVAQIGEIRTINIEEDSAESPSDQPPPQQAQDSVRTKTSLLNWFRRNKNRNKDDPDIGS